jgi:hypothetical protein
MLRLPLWVRRSSRRFHRPMVSIRPYRLNWVASMLLTAMLLALLSSEGWAESIRTAIPQANLNYLSIYVAEARGFFRDEGLENETVVISGPLATAALLSGDVDFSGGGGSGMRAALKGAPLKGIYFQTEKVTFYLIADPSIKTAADLKGKKVAVGSSGDYPGPHDYHVCRARRCLGKRYYPHRHGLGHQHQNPGNQVRRGAREHGGSRRARVRTKRGIDLAGFPR